MRINETVKLYRPSTPSGLEGLSEMELLESRVPVWLTFNRTAIFTGDGMEVISDGTVRVEAHHTPKEGDLVQLSNRKRYRIESANEVHSISGTLQYYDCSLVRDASHE